MSLITPPSDIDRLQAMSSGFYLSSQRSDENDSSNRTPIFSCFLDGRVNLNVFSSLLFASSSILARSQRAHAEAKFVLLEKDESTAAISRQSHRIAHFLVECSIKRHVETNSSGHISGLVERFHASRNETDLASIVLYLSSVAVGSRHSRSLVERIESIYLCAVDHGSALRQRRQQYIRVGHRSALCSNLLQCPLS